MTEKTKRQLMQRVEQILAAQDQPFKTINDIEKIAFTLGEEIKQAVVDEAGTEVEGNQSCDKDSPEKNGQMACRATKLPCPHCHKNAWFKGIREKTIQTLSGILTLKRSYYHCDRCHHGFFPLDSILQIENMNETISVQQKVAMLCSCMPYELAMNILSELTSINLSGRSSQRICTKIVAPIVEDYRIKREIEMLPLAYQPVNEVLDNLPTPEILYVEADGVHTPMRDGSWREMKVGVVRAEFKDGREQMASRYICTLNPAREFGKQWEALALSCGSLKAHCLTILGDGSAWIWNLASSCFPLAQQIQDFYHASEYVSDVGQDVFGDSKHGWLSDRLSDMKRSAWSDFWSAMKALPQQNLESLRILTTYFTNNASRMDYGEALLHNGITRNFIR